MDRETRRCKLAYDRLRAVRKLPDALGVLSASDSGYTAVAGSPISGSWYCETVREFQTGDQFLQVLIAEDGVNDIRGMMNKCAAVVIDARRYKVSIITPPIGAPKCWLLRANFIGDDTPAAVTESSLGLIGGGMLGLIGGGSLGVIE